MQEQNPGSAREAWSGPTVRIDWWQGSMDWTAGDGAARWKADWLVGELVERSPLWGRHYPVCYRDESDLALGLKADWGALPSRVMVQAGGTALARRRQRWSDRDLVLLASQWGFSPTRLDLALDVPSSSGVTPSLARELDEQGWVVCKLSEVAWASNTVDGGSTFYRRSRSRDVILRIYDKSAERSRKGQRLEAHDGSAVTRCELQLRDTQAKAAWPHLQRIAQDDAQWSEKFGEVVVGLILKKWRPLDAPAPTRNSQRVPTHAAFAAAWGDVRPVTYTQGQLDLDWSAQLQLRADVDNCLRHARSFHSVVEVFPEFPVHLQHRGAELERRRIAEEGARYVLALDQAKAVVRQQLQLQLGWQA